MRTIGRTTRLGAIPTLVLTLVAGLGMPTGAAATGAPSLRLRAVQDHLTSPRRPHERIVIDPGIYVAPVGGTFALHVERRDYTKPFSVHQVWTDDAGSHRRTLPSTVVHGWNGLGQFLDVVVRKASGRIVLHNRGAQPGAAASLACRRLFPVLDLPEAHHALRSRGRETLEIGVGRIEIAARQFTGSGHGTHNRSRRLPAPPR